MGSGALSSAAEPQAPGWHRWAALFNDHHQGAYGEDVGVDPSGSRLFVAGSAEHGLSTDQDFATAAYEQRTGRPLWLSWYNGSTFDQAQALAVAPDGSAVFVTGWSAQSDYYSPLDYATVAYDPGTGRQLWVARYDGPSSGNDNVQAIVVSPDSSRVFVAGWSAGADGNYDIATVAYDAATGTQLWVARTDLTECDLALALAVSPDGSRVFATGEDHCDSGPADIVTVAWDAATGRELWTETYDGTEHEQDIGNDVGVSLDGAMVYVAGESVYPGVADVLAYDAETGRRIWVVNGRATSALRLSIGPMEAAIHAVYVTGVVGEGWNFGTQAFDATTGAPLWWSQYSDPDGPTSPSDMALSADGSALYVTGGGDYVTVAYDARTGAERWVARSEVGYGQSDLGLALSPDGNLAFVTGFTMVQNDTDMLTVAYRTGGG